MKKLLIIFAVLLVALPAWATHLPFVAVVAWTDDNRIAKYKEFATMPEAVTHVARYGGFAIVNPKGSSGDWLIDPVAKTVSNSPLPVPPPITNADRAEKQMNRDPFMRAWVRRQARKEGKTVQQIMDEIKADVQ